MLLHNYSLIKSITIPPANASSVVSITTPLLDFIVDTEKPQTWLTLLISGETRDFFFGVFLFKYLLITPNPILTIL